MPQLDSVTYISSLFWIILSFSIYYVLYVKKVLPNISSILKVRNNKERVVINLEKGEEKKERLLKARLESLYKKKRRIW